MRTLSFLALVVLAFACATGPTTDSVALTTPASTVTVVYTNNSGQDLVLGFLQGVPKSAPNTVVTQLPWLKKGGSTPTWTVPTSVPAPTAGASSIKNYTKDYLFEIKAGKTLTLEVPSYPTNNGFRCVVAELVYRTKIVQVFTPKSGSPSNYLAFPDLATSAFVFDKFEAGLTQGTPGIWNITAVDFVGIPMQLSKDGETVGFKSGVTAQGLFNELGSLPSPYAEGATQSPNTSSTTYRFFSPAHITNTSTLFDAALTNDLQQLDSYTGTVKYGQYAFSSFTVTEKSSASPVRYAVSASVQDGSTVTLDTVTSKRALNGRIGQFAGASQAAKTLGGLLSAALCRGVVGTPSDWGDIVYSDLNCAKPRDYYQNAPYDEYSKTVHQYSIGGKNYGFSYDDYFGDEAGFDVVVGETVNVNILALSGTMTATANAAPAQNTGSLVVTMHADGAAGTWPLGTLEVAGLPIVDVTNKYCGLNSDEVMVHFKDHPDTTLHIYFDQTNPAYDFYVNGSKVDYLKISTMSYSSATRTLSFGKEATWECQVGGAGTLAINTTTDYPNSPFALGEMKVGGETLQAGINNLCGVADTVKIKFVDKPNRELWVYPGGASPYYDIRLNGQKVDTLEIKNLSFNTNDRTLVFPNNASWYEKPSCTSTTPEVVTFLLPSDYPTSGMGSITYHDGGRTVNSGTMYYCGVVNNGEVKLGLTTGYTIKLTTSSNTITIYKKGKPSEDNYQVEGMVWNGASRTLTLPSGASVSTKTN